MPDFKNQHFVPRAHLRPFSLESVGKAINLIHMPSAKAIPNAPVKNQCSKDYFYSTDPEFEKALGLVEGSYARAIRRIEQNIFTSEDLHFFKGFAYFQQLRTDAAALEIRKLYLEMEKVIYEGRDLPRPVMDLSDRAMVGAALAAFSKGRKYLEDLRTLILVAPETAEFVTSDDPSTIVSRFQSYRIGTQSFGIPASGVIMTMPLTPKHALFCFDSLVYSDPGAGAALEISETDVNVTNDVLFLKDTSAIYFRDWKKREELIASLRQAIPLRIPRMSLHFLVPDGEDDVGRRFRSLRPGENRTDFHEAVVATERNQPKPRRWWSFLRYKLRPRSFSNGSAAGHVRLAEWLIRDPD